MRKLLLALLILFTGFTGFSQEKCEPIKWMSFEEAVAANKKAPKKIIIDVYTDWCGWCKKLDQTTYTNASVIKVINEYFYPVKLNAEMKDTVRADGRIWVNPNPTAGRSTHELAAQLMGGKGGYPTTIFLDEGFNMITPYSGYVGPETMEQMLKFFGEDHYKKMSWEEYQKKGEKQ